MDEEKDKSEDKNENVLKSIDELKSLVLNLASQSTLQASATNTNSSASGKGGSWEDEHPCIQLWSGGPKWATNNVGAIEDWEVGNFFAWGELKPRDDYSKDSHKWCDRMENWSKYNKEDQKIILDPEDDVATQKWGDDWKIPTLEDWNALKNNCFWVYTEKYRNRPCKGYLVYKVKKEEDKGKEDHTGRHFYADDYSENDPHIFLPSTGERVDGKLDLRDDTVGLYWSSERDSVTINTGRSLNFADRHILPSAYSTRYLGRVVRPIRNSPQEKVLALGKEVVDLKKKVSTLEEETSKQKQEILSLKKENTSMQSVVQELKKEFEKIKISIPTSPYSGIVNGHRWVQLWEGGPKFATCNIGANEPWEYGEYYTWGGTHAQVKGKENYDYWTGKETLPSDRDIATLSWGEEWRMPTENEFRALLNECGKGEWVKGYKGSGGNGRLFRGKGQFAKQELFFPATGYCFGGNFYHMGTYGNCWSSVPYNEDYARNLYFLDGDAKVYNYARESGLSVRPVCSQN